MAPGLLLRCASGVGQALSLALLLGTAAAPAQTRAAPARTSARTSSASLDVPLPPSPRGMALQERPASQPWTVGASIGPMFSLSSAAATSIGLRLEASRPLKPLSPAVELQLFVPITVAYWGRTSSIGVPAIPPIPAVSGTVESKALWFAAVPSARFAFRIRGVRRLGLYADGGLGVAVTLAKTTTDQTFTGRNTTADKSVGAVVRIAGGGWYAVNDRLRITFEPMGLDFHIGSGSSTWSLLVGAAWRL